MGSRELTVSVVVPTYNGIGNLAYVFNSIERQTRVTNVVQIIVVDDASTLPGKKEKYEQLLLEYPKLPIEVIYLEVNGGPATARNAGIKKAVGDIVFFTDDDCDLPANTIERHLDVYRNRPQVSGVGGWYQSLSHIVRDNIFERFVFMKYLAYFGQVIYQSEILSTEYWSKRPLFPASNTAHLSIKRFVLRDVFFDEDFIAPGAEDPFFAEEVQRKGYLLQYIPLFVVHRKNLTVKKIWRYFRNRGMGLYVHRKKYGLKPGMGLYSGIKWFNGRLIVLAANYPALGRYRYRLLLIEALRRFYLSTAMDSYFAVKYFLKRGYIPKKKY